MVCSELHLQSLLSELVPLEDNSCVVDENVNSVDDPVDSLCSLADRSEGCEINFNEFDLGILMH